MFIAAVPVIAPNCKQPKCSSWDLLNPGIKLRSPTLQADSLPSEPPGKPNYYNI